MRLATSAIAIADPLGGSPLPAPSTTGSIRPMRAALLALFLLAACGGRGERRFGEHCSSDNECQHGLCVGGVHGDAPVCTLSCGTTTDCPSGWSCHGVTQANVLVCAAGASTPFGM
jgi:hypothetical protein